jgi:hypothetical protein
MPGSAFLELDLYLLNLCVAQIIENESEDIHHRKARRYYCKHKAYPQQGSVRLVNIGDESKRAKQPA